MSLKWVVSRRWGESVLVDLLLSSSASVCTYYRVLFTCGGVKRIYTWIESRCSQEKKRRVALTRTQTLWGKPTPTFLSQFPSPLPLPYIYVHRYVYKSIHTHTRTHTFKYLSLSFDLAGLRFTIGNFGITRKTAAGGPILHHPRKPPKVVNSYCRQTSPHELARRRNETLNSYECNRGVRYAILPLWKNCNEIHEKKKTYVTQIHSIILSTYASDSRNIYEWIWWDCNFMTFSQKIYCRVLGAVKKAAVKRWYSVIHCGEHILRIIMRPTKIRGSDSVTAKITVGLNFHGFSRLRQLS